MEQLVESLDSGDDEMYKFTTFFQPIKVIGQGAFGKVIQSIDNQTNQELAIKVINKKRMGDDFLEKVKQEARILEKLNHPNVVEFKKVCETETRILIAMELVKGGSLSQLMKDKKSQKSWFKEKEISQIMKSIMQGLAYIHGMNIVHRDLKPENILISDENDYRTVKIADFGLSSAFSLWTTNGLTEQCGTLLYMAPEFFASRSYSKQIDIWSCGITMHNLLDNYNHPFYDPKIDDTNSFKQKLLLPKWKIPSHFSNLAKNLLQKLSLINPTERYSAVQALQHPFITENENGAIPMTMNEHLLCFKHKEGFSQKLKAMLFIQFIKNKSNKINYENNQNERDINNLTNSQYDQLSINKQISETSFDCSDNVRASIQTEPSKTLIEDTSSSNKNKFKNIKQQDKLQLPNNNNTSYNGEQNQSGIQTNCINSMRKPPLNFMIKKQKSLNPEQQQQQLSSQIQKKRNSVLHHHQDYTDSSILIEIQENPLDQQGSYSQKTFKKQSIINSIVSNQNININNNQQQNVSSVKNSPILISNSPGNPLMALQMNRPHTQNIITSQKKKNNILNPSPPILPYKINIKKEQVSPLEYCETAGTPYNKDIDQQNINNNNPQVFLKQTRIKSASRIKQEAINVGKRRNSNLNQVSQLQVIKKQNENQDHFTNNNNNNNVNHNNNINNLCNMHDVILLSPKQNQPPISPNYYNENRNCVSSLQTQNNSTKKPPLKQFQTQDCSEIAKFYLQQQQQKQKQGYNANQLYPRNKIPLRSSEVIYKKQSKSLSREEDKKNIAAQNSIYGFLQIQQKESKDKQQLKVLTQQNQDIIDQDKDIFKGIVKGYLQNTKSRQNHLISKRFQI